MPLEPGSQETEDRAAVGDGAAQPRQQQVLAQLSSLVPGVRLMVGLVIGALVILALYVGRDLLIPLALASLLGFLLDPLVRLLRHLWLPRMAAVLLVVALAVGSIGAGVLYLGSQVTQLSEELPTYQNTIRQKLRHLRVYAQGPGVLDGARQVFNTVETEIAKVAPADASGRAAPARPARVQKVEIQPPANRPLEQAAEMLARLGEPVAMVGIVLLFVILILLDRSDLQDRLIRLMGPNMHMATDALDEASTRIGQYLRMQLVVNVSYGIPMALGLWWIGVPGAVLWGALAAVMRFVPYIGPMVSAVFPLLLAFAVDPGWNLLLWTLALIVLLELLSNNVIEPWLYGASTGLSTLSIILAATFWTALWGPIGLILSTPLTVCLLVLGRYIPALGFMEVLLGSKSVLDPAHKLYQRLLSANVEAAVDVAKESIRAHLPSRAEPQQKAAAVTQFYDEVAIPALTIASRNNSEYITAEHRLRLSLGTSELIEELQQRFPARPGQAGPVVHCVGLRWEIDALAAAMLAHMLGVQGYDAGCSEYALPHLAADGDFADWRNPQLVCLSTFSPHPQAAVRQMCRRLRGRWPQVKIAVAAWNAGDELRQPGAAEALGVDVVVNSARELALRVEHVLQAAGPLPYLPAERPRGDAQRVAALHASGVLQAAGVDACQECAVQAMHAFQVRWAHVAWVDADWVHTPRSLLVRSRTDAPQGGLPRDESVSAHVVAEKGLVVVGDVQRDPRFAQHPLLLAHGIRSFAAAPLVDRKSHILGALVVFDDRPRTLQADELELLQGMANRLMQALLHSDGGASGG
ncbi:MAG: AI-2E family transporter [Comamonas sp.]